MFILFSQSDSDVTLDPTRSEMNVGQLSGHSCFRIWAQKGSAVLKFELARRAVAACGAHLHEDEVQAGNDCFVGCQRGVVRGELQRAA